MMEPGERNIVDYERGETPWDHMSREDLLYEVWRLYGALESCTAVLRLAKVGHEPEAVWRPGGAGYVALSKASSAFGDLDNERVTHAMHEAFYRYADDLLYGSKIGLGWTVCPECGRMWSAVDGKPVSHCRNLECEGVTMRALQWSDLELRALQDTDG